MMTKLRKVFIQYSERVNDLIEDVAMLDKKRHLSNFVEKIEEISEFRALVQATRDEFGHTENYRNESAWQRDPNIALDAFVIMPNHVHGVINLVGAGLPRPYNDEIPSPSKQPTLGQIIAYYKYQSTKAINVMRLTPGARFWQRGYYEHIIRNDSALSRIREYIVNNPLRWELDRENLHASGKDDFDRWLASFSTKSVKEARKS
jgi:REP element-mobilizing transposase RayT